MLLPMKLQWHGVLSVLVALAVFISFRILKFSLLAGELLSTCRDVVLA